MTEHQREDTSSMRSGLMPEQDTNEVATNARAEGEAVTPPPGQERARLEEESCETTSLPSDRPRARERSKVKE